MPRCRRWTWGLGLSALAALVIVLAWPHPEEARANVACDVGSGPAGAVSGGIGAVTGGAIGGGNPVGDVCNEVTDGAVSAVTSPVSGAIEGLGNSIFDQINEWAGEGAAWLIEEVVEVSEETTTPDLTSRGFLETYGRMAAIGGLLAAAMLLAAVLEGIAQGNLAMLGRVVLVNLPLAFIATSVAYAIVQMALVGTDGLCHAIGAASQERSVHFFHSAVAGLGQAGGSAGEAVGKAGPAGPAVGKVAGESAVPLFVSILAAIVAGFAAFFVWLELLMRDAAVYVVALFMPLALAASIWPRWSGSLRRTGELLAVVIGSKFVIVSIIALAAGLVSTSAGRVEHILAAAALMVLACFSPFVLFRLVPLAEGAMAAAYGRRHAVASTMGGARNISSTAQSVRRAAVSSWSRGGGARTASGGPGVGRTGPAGAPGTSAAGAKGTAGSGGAAGAGATSAAAGATGGVALAGSLPIAAARGAKGSAEALADRGVASASGGVDQGHQSKAGGAQSKLSPTQPGSAKEPSPEGKRTHRDAVPRPSEGLADAGQSKPPAPGSKPTRPAPEPPKGGQGGERS